MQAHIHGTRAKSLNAFYKDEWKRGPFEAFALNNTARKLTK